MARWWKSGARYFKQLQTAAITMWVLKISDYLPISWTLLITLWVGASVSEIVCMGFYYYFGGEPEQLQ